MAAREEGSKDACSRATVCLLKRSGAGRLLVPPRASAVRCGAKSVCHGRVGEVEDVFGGHATMRRLTAEDTALHGTAAIATYAYPFDWLR